MNGSRHQEPAGQWHGYRYKRDAVERRLRSRSHRQLRHAGLRHRGLGLGPGRRAHSHHCRKPSTHRDHRSHGAPLGIHRARHGVRPARHHPRARASARPRACSSNASSTSTIFRRTSSSSAARASSTTTASSSARSHVNRSGRQPALERRGRGAARDDDQDARRRIFPALSARQLRSGGDLHPQGRAHPARRTADSVRPFLCGPTRIAKAVDLLVEGRNNAVSSAPVRCHTGLSRRRLRRESLSRSLGTDSRSPDAPVALRSAA